MRKVFGFAVVLSLVFLLVGCTTEQVGSKCVTIEVSYVEEEIELVSDVCTDALTLEELLFEHEEVYEPEITEASFGNYLSGLVGYNFETLGLSYYWGIYVNGEYGLSGISDQEVVDGDTYTFEATGF